jgi:hypothetical protein
MPDGRDILRDWQEAMEAIASTARDAAGRTQLPKALVGDVFGLMLDPLDAVFDLLEESGKTFRAQADALEEASNALAQTAKLMQNQAEIYENTIKALREPTAVARRMTGAKARKGKAKKKS